MKSSRLAYGLIAIKEIDSGGRGDFKIQTGHGIIYGPLYFTSVGAPHLENITLVPGGRIDGTVPFEVNDYETSWQLIYQPNWLRDSERIYFNLHE